MWVLNAGPSPGKSFIAEFGPHQHGNVAPAHKIAGSHTDLFAPSDLAITPSGGLVVSASQSDSIVEFAPGARGNATPRRVIAGSKTGMADPASVAVARNGAIWVLVGRPADGIPMALEEFAPGATGDASPVRTITGPDTELAPATGIALTPDGRHIWVTHFGETIVGPQRAGFEEFSTTASADAAPVRFVSGDRTGLQFPQDLIVNQAGDVVVSNLGDGEQFNASIRIFGPKAHGNAAPISVIQGSRTGLDVPGSAALGARGDLWVPNGDTDSVVRFKPDAHGNAKPTRRIGGSLAALSGPSAVVVLSRSPSAPRGLRATASGRKRIRLSWRRPSHPGGGLIGYRISRKVSKHGRWNVVATTDRRSFTTRPVTSHRRLFYRVAAYNEAGPSPTTPSVSVKAG